jgi:hypothetical protein
MIHYSNRGNSGSSIGRISNATNTADAAIRHEFPRQQDILEHPAGGWYVSVPIATVRHILGAGAAFQISLNPGGTHTLEQIPVITKIELHVIP